MNSIIFVSHNFALRNKFVQFCTDLNIDLKLFANANNALEYLKKQHTDCCFVDFVLSGFDGLELVKIINEVFEIKTIFLASKNFDTVFKTAKNFGAFKCLDYNFLFDNFCDIVVEEKQDNSFDKNLEELTSKLCLEIGITPYLSGYKYIKEAIILTANEPEKYKLVTRSLYPQIAQKFCSSPDRVERSIRHALNMANESDKILNLNKFLNTKTFEKGDRLTNSQFIAIVADRLLCKLRALN